MDAAGDLHARGGCAWRKPGGRRCVPKGPSCGARQDNCNVPAQRQGLWCPGIYREPGSAPAAAAPQAGRRAAPHSFKNCKLLPARPLLQHFLHCCQEGGLVGDLLGQRTRAGRHMGDQLAGRPRWRQSRRPAVRPVGHAWQEQQAGRQAGTAGRLTHGAPPAPAPAPPCDTYSTVLRCASGAGSGASSSSSRRAGKKGCTRGQRQGNTSSAALPGASETSSCASEGGGGRGGVVHGVQGSGRGA